MITAVFIVIVSNAALTQPVFTGTLVCGKCGHIEKSRAAMLAHTCSLHGLNCPATPTRYIPPVATKTQQQIREEAEKKDLQEAAEEANDQGDKYYGKKDWATAINYFKVALEYAPDYKDAIYNLKKAEGKLEEERQLMEAERRRKEEEEKQKQLVDQTIQTVTLPPALSKYMEEADKIIVPPPSWESNIEEQVRQIRLGQNDENGLITYKNIVIAAFEQASDLNKGDKFLFKLLLICDKATNAALDEANIVAFRQNAWYERTLQVLKDPKQAPLLIAAIKALREKKPMPAGVTPEIEKMAKATQDPSLGNSSAQMAMSAFLSKESKAAVIQTIKMEAMSLVCDEIKDEAWKYLEDRVPVLKMVNEKIKTGKDLMRSIDKGIELADKSQAPLFKSIIQTKIDELQKNIQPIKPIPEAILNVMSFFDVAKKADN